MCSRVERWATKSYNGLGLLIEIGLFSGPPLKMALIFGGHPLRMSASINQFTETSFFNASENGLVVSEIDYIFKDTKISCPPVKIIMASLLIHFLLVLSFS